MSKLVIEGGKPLRGEIDIHGAKNAVLPILAASIMCKKGITTITNCPDLKDVRATIQILRYLGARVKKQGDTIIVDARGHIKSHIPRFLMHKLRSSIFFLGAICTRNQKARFSFPGGCELGARPIDLHIKALSSLGCTIKEKKHYIQVKSDRIQKGNVCLSFPSVGATENIMLATCTLPGITVIENAACEPEITDLANFLNAMGASISGAGTKRIEICGVSELRGTTYRVMPDRIATITYLCCAAATGGSITVKNTVPEHIESSLTLLAQCGCHVEAEGSSIHLSAPKRLTAPPTITTEPYPGFPTDAQSLFLALLATAEGTSVIYENIFENRFKTAYELIRMGADIDVFKNRATVTGVSRLLGSKLYACDLRGGAAMVIAALSAIGTTEIDNIGLIDRGYESIEKNLRRLGASIRRIQ